MMTYPLAIGGACIITSIIGAFFVKLPASQSIMGALYRGFIASAVLSLGAIWFVTYGLIGFGAIAGVDFTGQSLFICAVVGLVVTGIVMWMLLHFTRMMKVLQRASNRPVGFVDSAVMLNAKLKPGVNLLHVMAMTKAIGEQLSDKGAQPEIYRWTDGGGSHVTCEFRQGKSVTWTLYRPPAEAAPGVTTDS
jgi:hypothetical protein